MPRWESSWAPYVPVAERRRQAAREAEKQAKRGAPLEPVHIQGRTIARTVWGRAWCDHLEEHCDYDNRLPRGRTYARNGSVIDLKVSRGQVAALVMGSKLYRVKVDVEPVQEARLEALRRSCAGAIHSVVELLSGQLSGAVMTIFCDPHAGIFPRSSELRLSCSCPDWASMCKHVAAALYGIGARLDHRPELLFALRGVDHQDFIAQATAASLLDDVPGDLDDSSLESLFGIELDDTEAPPPPAEATPPSADSLVVDDLVTAKELLAEGVPRSTFASWITAGDMLRTERRGVYLMTQRGWHRLERYLTRGNSATVNVPD